MLCLSGVHLKRKDNFKWIKIVIFFFYWFCLSFQLRTNDHIWTNLSICLYANEGGESKNKGFHVSHTSQFSQLFSVEKGAHYTRVNTVLAGQQQPS